MILGIHPIASFTVWGVIPKRDNSLYEKLFPFRINICRCPVEAAPPPISYIHSSIYIYQLIQPFYSIKFVEFLVKLNQITSFPYCLKCCQSSF